MCNNRENNQCVIDNICNSQMCSMNTDNVVIEPDNKKMFLFLHDSLINDIINLINCSSTICPIDSQCSILLLVVALQTVVHHWMMIVGKRLRHRVH